MKKITRLISIVTVLSLLCPISAYAGQRAVTVRGTPQRVRTVESAPSLPANNPRSRMNTKETIKYDDAKQSGSVKIATKTSGGRNLLVPESKENASKKITITKVVQGDVLSLPDNGEQLNELIPAPNDKVESIDEQDIDEALIKTVDRYSKKSPRYPYVTIYGYVTDDEFKDFTEYMDRLIREDPGLVNEAVNNGWKIVLTSYDLDDLLFDSTTEGVEGCTYFPTDGKNGRIFVHAGRYSYSVIHEFGHTLDCLSGYPSQSEAFRNIFIEESANLTDYGKASELEFFAEIYMYSILQPDTTKTACPKAVDFISIYRKDIDSRAA